MMKYKMLKGHLDFQLLIQSLFMEFPQMKFI